MIRTPRLNITVSTLAEIRHLEGKAMPIPDIGRFQRNADADDAMLQHFSGRAGSADPNATSASVVPETATVRFWHLADIGRQLRNCLGS